jgi:hypothetical protein
MFLSRWLFFRRCLKGTHCLGPHLVKVRAQPRHSLWIQPVQPPRSGSAVGHQACILQYPEVLRYRWTTNGQCLSQLMYGNRPGRKLLKDRHARCIAQCVEAGL